MALHARKRLTGMHTGTAAGFWMSDTAPHFRSHKMRDKPRRVEGFFLLALTTMLLVPPPSALAATAQAGTRCLMQAPAQCSTPLDLVFLIDSTAGGQSANFTLALRFAAAVASGHPTSAGETRMGISTYAASVHHACGLDGTGTAGTGGSSGCGGGPGACSVCANTGGAIAYRGGSTANTGAALRHVLTEPGFAAGLRPRTAGVPRVAVVVTDGKSADDVAAPAAALRDAGWAVYAVGIGTAPPLDVAELGSLASPPSTTHVLRVPRYADLLDGGNGVRALAQMRAWLCTEAAPMAHGVAAQVADVLAVADGARCFRAETTRHHAIRATLAVHGASLGSAQMFCALGDGTVRPVPGPGQQQHYSATGQLRPGDSADITLQVALTSQTHVGCCVVGMDSAGGGGPARFSLQFTDLGDTTCAWDSGHCGTVRGPLATAPVPWPCGTEVLQCCTSRGTARVCCDADTLGWFVGSPCTEHVAGLRQIVPAPPPVPAAATSPCPACCAQTGGCPLEHPYAFTKDGLVGSGCCSVPPTNGICPGSTVYCEKSGGCSPLDGAACPNCGSPNCAASALLAERSAPPCTCTAFEPAGCSPDYAIVDGICAVAPPPETATVPGKPTDVTAAVHSSTALFVRWTAAPPNGSPITGYVVEVDVNSDMDRGIGTTLRSYSAGSGTSFVADGLTTGTPYYVRVFATNAKGSGLRARASPLPVTPAGRPHAPARIEAVAINATAVRVSVSSCPCNDRANDCCHGAIVTSMVLERSGSSHFTSPTSIQYTHPPSLPAAGADYSIVLTANTGDTLYFRAMFANVRGVGHSNATSVSLAADGSSEAWAAPSCRDIHTWFPAVPSGARWLRPPPLIASGRRAFQAYCDMVTDDGGWTLVTKLRDVDAQLDNHLSHKFAGATWFNNDARSIAGDTLTRVVDSISAEAEALRGMHGVLWPFPNTSAGDALWGSVDPAIFPGFTSVLVFHAREMAFQTATASDHGADDFLRFDVSGGSTAWAAFPAAVSSAGLTCVKRHVRGVDSGCTTNEGTDYASRAGDNSAAHPFVAGDCTAAGPTAVTRYQGFCVYAVLKPQYARGFNFISWDTNNNAADGLHETCHEPSSAQTTTCADAFGRRFELYVR